MASVTSQERIDHFKKIVKTYEPYSLDILDNLAFDDEEYNENNMRFVATVCLKALIDTGFSEDEVNPWKKKN